MKFATIALPKTAVRCSWLLRQADMRCNRFARLLARLDPAWPVEHARGRMAAYYGLLNYLSTLFPVFEPWFEDPDDAPGWDAMYEAGEFGIPVNLYGRDYDERDRDDRHAAFAAVEWFVSEDRLRENPAYSAELECYPALKKIAHQVREFDTQHYEPASIAPVRGQVWRPPWNGLPDLVRYCQMDTGLFWLDNSHLDVMESGGSYPPWSIGEIRALAREWERAKPVWQRIEALADYIDIDPRPRVPLLLWILSGDAEAKASMLVRKKCEVSKVRSV